MPPASKTPENVILEIVKKYDIFDHTGKVLSQKNGPWEKVISEFHDAGYTELTVHNLYMKFQGSVKRQNDYKSLRREYMQRPHSNTDEGNLPDTNLFNAGDNIISSEGISLEIEEDDIQPSQKGVSNLRNDGENLRKLKSDVKYSATIIHLSERKFNLSFTTPEQYSLWKKLITRANLTCILTTFCDITEEFQIDDVFKSGDVCLFMLCVQLKTNDEIQIVRVGQALSEEKNFSFVLKCLLDFLKTVQQPKTFVTGYSSILTNASCFAFNCITINMYNLVCHKNLLNDKNYLPKTSIRVDIISVLCFFNSRSAFQAIPSKSLKEIILKIVILLSESHNLQSFTTLATNFLILILCESYNDLVLEVTADINEQLKLHTSKIDFVQKRNDNCQKNNFVLNKNLRFMSFEDTAIYSHYDSPEVSLISDFVNEIYNMAQGKVESSEKKLEPYPFYLPELKNTILKLCSEYPIRTSVIHRSNLDDCSLFTDCAFDFEKSAKVIGFPLSVTDFLTKYIEEISSQRKLIDFNDNDLINQDILSDNDHHVLNFAENWKGLNDNEETEENDDNDNEFLLNNFHTL